MRRARTRTARRRRRRTTRRRRPAADRAASRRAETRAVQGLAERLVATPPIGWRPKPRRAPRRRSAGAGPKGLSYRSSLAPLESKPALLAQRPVHAAAGRHHPPHILSKLGVERSRPRHKLKPQPVL